MKLFKPNFSLDLFEEIETFEAEELKLITGGAATEMCSNAHDTDSGRGCSISDDTDNADPDSASASDGLIA
ncbi:MAG: hypothetical protein AAGG75_03710 [Bacteroidota bacterium]